MDGNMGREGKGWEGVHTYGLGGIGIGIGSTMIPPHHYYGREEKRKLLTFLLFMVRFLV